MKSLARPYRARRSWDAYPDNVTASKPPNVNVASARQQLRVASSSAVSQFASSPLDVDLSRMSTCRPAIVFEPSPRRRGAHSSAQPGANLIASSLDGATQAAQDVHLIAACTRIRDLRRAHPATSACTSRPFSFRRFPGAISNSERGACVVLLQKFTTPSRRIVIIQHESSSCGASRHIMNFSSRRDAS